MTTENKRLISSLLAKVDSFIAGDLTVNEIRIELVSCSKLLERGLVDFEAPVSNAAADLEGIQFMKLLDKQRSAAVSLLDSLRNELKLGLRRQDELDEELDSRFPMKGE